MKRTVKIDRHGIRTVTLDNHGEFWIQRTIVPTHLVALLQDMIEGVLDDDYYGHYGGPGQSFSHAAYICFVTPNFVTFCQSGGLDI